GFLSAISMLIDPAFALGQRVVIDVGELIRCLSRLSRDKMRAREMGLQGRERARAHFSWQKVVQQYETLWGQLVEGGKRGAAENAGGGLGYMDYANVFEGYPSGHIDLKSRVCLSERFKGLAGPHSELCRFSPAPTAGFSEELDTCILKASSDADQISVQEVL